MIKNYKISYQKRGKKYISKFTNREVINVKADSFFEARRIVKGKHPEACNILVVEELEKSVDESAQ